jgi:uncharacterized membrane protein YphA (DoxX/SURF4 family)
VQNLIARNFWSALALCVGFLYHGGWNLSSEGALWWNSGQTWFWPELRVWAGALEIVIAFAIWLPKLRLYAAALAFMLMVGAIRVHWDEGFSFKKNGYETPLLYALIALQLVWSAVSDTFAMRKCRTPAP